MKKILSYSSILILSMLTSCYSFGPCVDGAGQNTEEIRDVSDFYSVSNTTSFDVYVTQGDEYSVIVNAQANILPLIETYSSGGTLIIKTREFTCIRSTSTVEVYVTLPEIEELNLTGSGMIVCEEIVGDLVELSLTSSGRLVVDSVFCNEIYIKHTASGNFESEFLLADYGEFKLTGSGNIDFGEIESEQIQINHNSSGIIRGGLFFVLDTDITLTGSGNIILYGDTESLRTTHTSSGRIDALDLFAIDVRSHSSGSGNTYINVSGDLDVTILGSGDVVYLGSPTAINSRITGSGNLRLY